MCTSFGRVSMIVTEMQNREYCISMDGYLVVWKSLSRNIFLRKKKLLSLLLINLSKISLRVIILSLLYGKHTGF